MKLSEKLKFLRKFNNLTQAKLAEISDVSVYSIKRYETDKFQPKKEQVYKLAQALDISPNALFDEDDFNFRLETDSDVISLIILLAKKDVIKIAGERNERGLIKPNTLNIEFKNKSILNIINTSLYDSFKISLSNSLIIPEITLWEALYTEYNIALEDYKNKLTTKENVESTLNSLITHELRILSRNLKY